MNAQRISAVVYRHLTQLPVDIGRIFCFFYHPPIDIILVGTLGMWISGNSVQSSAIHLLLTGIVFWRVTQRIAGDSALLFSDELISYNLTNLFVTPLTLGEWVCGVIVAEMCISVAMVLFCAGIVWLFYGFNIFVIGWYFLLIWFGMLLCGAAIGILSTAGLMIWGKRMGETVWIAAWALAPLSGVYVSAQALPSWLQTVAYAVPTNYFMECAAQVLHHEPVTWGPVAWGFMLDIFYIALALLVMFAAFRISKRRGLARLMD